MPDALVRPRTAWALLLVIVAVAALAWWAQTPPSPAPATAPPAEFSAERAAADPGAVARDRVVARFTELGLAPDVVRGTGIVASGQSVAAGRADSVVATLRGTASTGRVVVTAHGGDTPASVAALLEIARALTAGPPPRNDVVFLVSDDAAEGLIGAAVLGRRTPGPGVVVDGAGPGGDGPSVVLQVGPGSAPVVAAYAADAARPAGDSVTPALFPLLPDRTAVDALGGAGYAGLSLGPNGARPAAVAPDPGALQQHGDTMLSLVRGFADRDVAALTGSTGATFVTLFGLVLHYSDAWLVPLTLISLVVVIVFVMIAGRQRGTTGPRLVAGSVIALLGLLVAVGLGSGLAQLLLALRPGYGALGMAETYRPGFHRFAVAALAAFVVAMWAGVLRRRVSRLGVAYGTVLWLALIGVVLSGVAPGAAFVATLPAITAGLGGIAALLIGDGRPRDQLLAWAAGGLPAALLLLLQGRAALSGGLLQAPLATLLYAAAGLLVLPVVAAAVGRRTRLVPVVALLATAGLVAAAFQTDVFDDAHPQPTALAYVADAGGGTQWVSSDVAPPEWTRRYAPTGGAVAVPLPAGALPRWHGPAPAIGLALPEATVLGTRSGPGGTIVALRVRSVRGAGTVTVQADRAVLAAAVTIEGDQPVSSAVGPAAPVPGADARFPFRLQITDPPPSGATVELTVADPGRMVLAVSDTSDGIDAVPGLVPRPPGLVRGSGPDSDVSHRVPPRRRGLVARRVGRQDRVEVRVIAVPTAETPIWTRS